MASAALITEAKYRLQCSVFFLSLYFVFSPFLTGYVAVLRALPDNYLTILHTLFPLCLSFNLKHVSDHFVVAVDLVCDQFDLFACFIEINHSFYCLISHAISTASLSSPTINNYADIKYK